MDKTFYLCENPYCKGYYLKHEKGNIWRCDKCGRLYKKKSTLDTSLKWIELEFSKDKKKQPIKIDDIDEISFKKIVSRWKKKNM